jgi:hypothetical protein
MTIKALKNIAKATSRIFGEKATRVAYETNEHICVSVIFQESYSDFDANGVAINERQPTAWARYEDGFQNVDLLLVNNEEYRIHAMEPDGYGLIRLDLGLN